MSRVVLAVRAPITATLEAEAVAPDRFAALDERAIASLPVWCGGRRAALGDFFDVRGERSPRLRIEGDVTAVRGLGTAMAAGELLIDGDAGDRVGAGMSGGSIVVVGRAGDGAGVGMAGGSLLVRGSAGVRLGGHEPGASRGMTGGEIVVLGSAGDDAAARVRRGLVAIAGDVGAHAARAMIAGTLVVFGRVGGTPARGNKRGSVVAVGPASPPATYRYACTYEPPYLRLLLAYLSRRYELPIAAEVRDGRFRRYCGDAGAPGKGEFLLYEQP